MKIIFKLGDIVKIKEDVEIERASHYEIIEFNGNVIKISDIDDGFKLSVSHVQIELVRINLKNRLKEYYFECHN